MVVSRVICHVIIPREVKRDVMCYFLELQSQQHCAIDEYRRVVHVFAIHIGVDIVIIIIIIIIM